MKPTRRYPAVALVAVLLSGILTVYPGAESGASDPNSFNRLLKPPSERNPPPASDGIHDPQAASAQLLQAPGDAFAELPAGKSGNYVDWRPSTRKKIYSRWCD